MKIKTFTVKNYRSISSKSIISFSSLTTLVGKNNVGKSNVLSALKCATWIIENPERSSRIGYSRYSSDKHYDCSRDYPVQLRNVRGRRPTYFSLEYELNSKEKKKFARIANFTITGSLEIEITINSKGETKIDLITPSIQNTSKSFIYEICHFVSDNISFRYIPAIRTEETTKGLLQSVIVDELKALRANKEYKMAAKKIYDLQNNTLKVIAKDLVKPLGVFIDNINGINIENSSDKMIMPFGRDFSISIDDGVSTDIAYKGDGIKSLIALAILNNSNDNNVIVAIEEPESHLHPEAMRNLYNVINEISKNKQVIITTHNPLFIKRNNVSSNIVVSENGAKPAKSIKEIRNVLGIISSDNLENANKVLLVEGETDKIYLEKILSCKSRKLKKALENNTFVIEPLHGASKLSSEINRMNNNLCDYVVLLDDDECGNEAYKVAFKKNLIKEKECFFTICKGLKKSEFEDCIKLSSYCTEFKNQYGIDLNSKKFKSNNDVWSNRIKEEFANNGKHFNEDKEEEIKFFVANTVSSKIKSANFGNIFYVTRSGFIEKVIKACEEIL